MEFLRKLLSSGDFMPHGYCYLWRPGLVWLHLVSDALIALAYFSIPFTLIYFVRKRRDVPFNWMFACFGMFILACGATHAMEIWTLWHATYWVSGAVKVVTALASVPTAVLLIHLVPQAVALPSPKALRIEIAERTRAQNALDNAKKELELRVQERTAKLRETNEQLLTEVQQRKQAQEKLRRSEEELQSLAGRLISIQEDERKRVARDLHDDLSQCLALHCVDLDVLRQTLGASSGTAREVERLRSQAGKLSLKVREISHNLHHPQMALGLRVVIASLCREFFEQHGVAAELSQEGDLSHVPESISMVLFRVLQEALNNVAKHSGSDQVAVFLRVEGDQVLLRVTDRGRGFDAEGVPRASGLGLVSMRERLRLVGGTISITSSLGLGTSAEAVVPIVTPERPTSEAAA
jgi:signal transduction histidine kinase